VIKNQARSATCLKALGEKQKEVNAVVSSTGPTPTFRFTQSPKQGKNLREVVGDEDETTHDPTKIRIEVPPRDSSLFYSNGNPKLISTGRWLIAEPKSRRAIRPGKRGKGGGRRRFRGSTSHNFGEPIFSYGGNYSPSRISEADPPSTLLGDPSPSYGPNPSLSQNECATPQTHKFPRHKTTDSDKTVTDPGHSSEVHRVKMVMFSLIKYAASLRTEKRIYHEHTRVTHQNVGADGIAFPSQHDSTKSRDHAAECGAQTGAACFEPGTALLLQNPLDQDTSDPDQALSRPIDQMKYRDTILAERLGSRGQGSVFYLARITCVMFFEIPHDDNLSLIKSTQKDTLSTGVGVKLTKNHHIRKYGRLSQDWMNRWHLTHEPKNPAWREVAYLGRGTSPSRRTTPVKRVVNLVLDPPGNVVIMTPNLDLHISASLGYHMRRRKLKDGSLELGSDAPVYT